MKKFSAILICLLMIITCGLAGCATFSIDRVKYYNEVLATVDETKITRFDLLSAYNSYGNSYYVQQMGQSESEALQNTLDLLIDRELMYQYALDNNETYKPTAYQVNEVVKEIFDSVDSQMETYIKKAKQILNIDIEESDDEEESDETAYTLASYTYSPRAKVKSKLNNGVVEYYIEYITPKEDETFEKLIDSSYLTNFTQQGTINELKTKYFEHLRENLNYDEGENATAIYNKIRTLFAQDLIDYEYYLRDENGKAYDKSTESLFDRYFERTFDSQIQSQYLDNIRIHYLENEQLSIDLLIKEYDYLSTLSYNAYSSNYDAYNNKMKDISTDGDSVLYHPETGAKFGYFIHTLISFDDIKENLKLLENEKDPQKYEEKYNEYIASLKVKARDSETGLVPEDAEELSLAQVIAEYNEIQSYSNYNEKLSAFINFMFKYTGDTATLSAGMPYVIGYDPSSYTGEIDSNNSLTGTYSAMVTEFTKEAISLMKNNEKGSMSTANLSEINNLCITEYGIHLLFYVDNVNAYDIPYSDNSKVYIQNNNKLNEEKFNLYTRVINPLTKETYFDKMFDIVYPASSGEVYSSNNGYTEYEEELTTLSEKSHEVTKNITKIKATKTTL